MMNKLTTTLQSAWSSCRNEENLKHDFHASGFPRLKRCCQLDHHVVATEFLNLQEFHAISAWWSSWQQSWCWWSILVLSLFHWRKAGFSSSLFSKAWRIKLAAMLQSAWSSCWYAMEFLKIQVFQGISAWWSSWQQSCCWWSILVLSLFNCRKPGLSSSLLSRAWRMIFDCAEASAATRSARGVTSELLGFHRSWRCLQDHRKTSSCDSC